MSEMPRRRADVLAALLGVDHRGRLPKDLGIEMADRLFEAAVVDEDDAALLTIAGSITYQDGYRRARLADFDFVDLRRLIREARWRLGGLGRQIEELQRLRADIAAFVEPPKERKSDDDRGEETPVRRGSRRR
jgi:hypothetical protein